MSKTRYGHSSVGGGDQDQGERKDDGWTSRQGGSQARQPGRKGSDDLQGRDARRGAGGDRPLGTNTQGDLAGIGRAADDVARERDGDGRQNDRRANDRDEDAAGTDQPPRMGGPLGPDPEHPHLPEGAQDGENRGTGAGGFDRGVDASRIGTLHQGVRPEDEP